jgi:hypothetical protein
MEPQRPFGIWFVGMVYRFGVHPRPGPLPAALAALAYPIGLAFRFERLTATQAIPGVGRFALAIRLF